MSNDFKIYRDNIDADVRSVFGQANEISKVSASHDFAQGLLGSAPDDQGSTAAISNLSARVKHEVYITQLPPNFTSPFETPTIKEVAPKLDSIKPGLDSEKGAFGKLMDKLFSKEKEHSGPSLSR